MKQFIHLKYLTANDRDIQWGLTVKTVGHQMVSPHESYPPQNHPVRYLFTRERGRILQEYQLLYISEGEGIFKSAHYKQTRVTAGQMFLLFPGEWHVYYPNSETGWSEFWIGFGGENINNRVNREFFKPGNPIFHVGLNNRIVDLYKDAIDIAQKQPFGFQQMLAGIVNLLLGMAYSMDSEHAFKNAAISDKINAARTYISTHIYQEIRPEEIAKHLNIGYTWFRRIFKEYTGFSPATYVLNMKIQKCKELLTNSNDTSYEIGFKMGFENPDYFTTLFKRKTGMTPIQYRNFTRGHNLLPGNDIKSD